MKLPESMSGRLLKFDFVPTSLKKLLLELLSQENRPAFFQVATVNEGVPEVRTVHIRYIEEYASIGFNTHSDSAKSVALESQPVIAGCYYDPLAMIQIRWTATTKKITSCSEDPSDAAVRVRMWNLTRTDVRKAYWKEYLSALPRSDVPYNDQEPCPTFTTILCFPTRWDLYQMHPQDYALDQRTIFSLTDTGWTAWPTSTLHSFVQSR